MKGNGTYIVVCVVWHKFMNISEQTVASSFQVMGCNNPAQGFAETRILQK